MSKHLDEKVSLLFEGVPPLLKDIAKTHYRFLKTGRFSPADLYIEMEQYVKLLSSAYLNSRAYLSIYDRRFIDMKMIERIEKLLLQDDEFIEKDFYNLARVNFDFNGLKALNDLGGHLAGNRGLRIFIEILKAGETTRWLEEQGFTVIPSAEGAEEYGMLIFGQSDLRPIAHEIVSRYFREVWNAPVGPLLNFAHPSVREKLALLGMPEDVPADFKFRIAINVGVVLFGEALAQFPIEKMSDSYDVLIRTLIAKMFAMADLRARAHRSAFRRELAKKNPTLVALYSRLSNEVIHLEKELNKKEARIHDLELQLAGGEQERAPNTT